MGSKEEERDDMGSLFEGMILFNPSQIADDQAYDLDHHHHPSSSATDAATSSSVSQPLDENLFSDLTLVTPVQTLVDDPNPSPPSTTTATAAVATTTTREVPPVSRQISRKKKRAGLRIGYGRADDHPPLPLSDADSRSVELDFSPSHDTTKLDPEIEASSPLRPDSEFESPALLPPLPDSPPTTMSTSENELSHSTFQDIDSSLASIHNHAVQDNASVSDAQPTVLQKENQEKELDVDDDEKASSSSEMKFERIRVQISEKLKHTRELATSISAARKDSIRTRRKAADNVNLASIKHRELEKKLEEACEAEDFEMAERVSESLAAAEREKAGFLNALRDAEMECDAIDSKMQEVLEFQVAAEEECASLLEHFAMEAVNDADLVLKKAEVLYSKEMDEWFSSTEALEVKKMELEIESHLINEARLVLNDSIENSIEDDKREKEFLCKKKDVLTDELEKLLALVKEKEKEIAENDSKIKAVEKRISDVVSVFQGVQSSIDANYDNLRSGFSQMDLETEALSMKKKEIDNFLSQDEDRGAKLRELARVSADEAKAYQEVVGLRKSLMLSVLKSREDKVRLAKTEEKLSEDVQVLRQKVSSARASLQELSSTKSSIQQEIASSKQRIIFIDKRVPELEAEKKVAAAARNFKEAARIAAEAKTLIFEKEDVQIKMERAMLELGKLEEEIKDTINRLQETEGLILSKEKEVAFARFQRLLLIAGAATAERSAALELSDVEEAKLLLAEAEAADSEAKKLQPIYNFREEEFANLPKHFISMELVSNLGGKQLAELAASIHLSAL
ncbi:hypothetical protein L1049_025468 [Liquidambar formosana]|uniref:UVR domain-containing protein n=1 Tax=Liquidambar formosana TaxID=63359 RepID=A0AAP0R5N1_LIQFO